MERTQHEPEKDAQEQRPQARRLTQVVRQRREREKQELRQAILSAARDIAFREGWQAVTIRKVAEHIEYSPPTIYEHFESKEDILAALLTEGFRQVALNMQAAKLASDDPETRLFKMADAYWDCAWRNPELYQVMHGLKGALLTCEVKPPEQREAYKITQEAVADWMQFAGIPLQNTEDAVDILRATMNGLISLAMVDRVRGGQERGKLLMQRALRDFLTAWKNENQ